MRGVRFLSVIKPYTYSYSIQGVQVKPLTEDGREVSIRYDGLLARSGAGQIYLHCGFGDKTSWEHVNDLPMSRQNDSWEKTISLKDSRVNFCFRDNVNNWDNNNGDNWAYQISP